MRFVLLLFAVLVLAGCGAGANGSASTTVTVTVTATTAAPATTARPDVTCSTTGLNLTLPDQKLPPAVAAVRERIFSAALACDYDRLETIALEKGKGFSFSYGAATDPSTFWKQAEQDGARDPKPMQALATILTLPVTRNETRSYAWPSAYTESPTAADYQALADSGLYSQERVDLMKAQGTGYLGWRTAITPGGDWQFFLAGD